MAFKESNPGCCCDEPVVKCQCGASPTTLHLTTSLGTITLTKSLGIWYGSRAIPTATTIWTLVGGICTPSTGTYNVTVQYTLTCAGTGEGATWLLALRAPIVDFIDADPRVSYYMADGTELSCIPRTFVGVSQYIGTNCYAEWTSAGTQPGSWSTDDGTVTLAALDSGDFAITV